MLPTRETRRATRVAALWLLVVSVLVGPLGLGHSAAAAVDACGTSCPCEGDRHVDHADGEHASVTAEHDDCDGDRDRGEPAEEECPDDCPDCSCCPGIVLGVVPTVMPSIALSSHACKSLIPPDAPALGALSGVFRPPRSLA